MNGARKVVFHSVRQEDAEQKFLERRRQLAEYREDLLIIGVLIVLFGAFSMLMIMVSWQGALLGVLYLLPSQWRGDTTGRCKTGAAFSAGQTVARLAADLDAWALETPSWAPSVYVSISVTLVCEILTNSFSPFPILFTRCHRRSRRTNKARYVG